MVLLVPEIKLSTDDGNSGVREVEPSPLVDTLHVRRISYPERDVTVMMPQVIEVEESRYYGYIFELLAVSSDVVNPFGTDLVVPRPGGIHGIHLD